MKFLQKFAIIWVIIIFLLTASYFYFYRPSLNFKIPQFDPTPTITQSPIPANTNYQVVKVIDGDTIDVNIDGKTQRIRLIGIDAPETSTSKNSCFGIQASQYAASVLNGKRVNLVPDSTQDDKDKYGRLLRYVYLEDGTFFNKLMVENGFAREYTYQKPYQYQSELINSQNNAIENKVGLWSGVCPN
jgi:micrococcal nuclease